MDAFFLKEQLKSPSLITAFIVGISIHILVFTNLCFAEPIVANNDTLDVSLETVSYEVNLVKKIKEFKSNILSSIDSSELYVIDTVEISKPQLVDNRAEFHFNKLIIKPSEKFLKMSRMVYQQIPDKFLQTIELTPDNIVETLKKNDNMVLFQDEKGLVGVPNHYFYANDEDFSEKVALSDLFLGLNPEVNLVIEYLDHDNEVIDSIDYRILLLPFPFPDSLYSKYFKESRQEEKNKIITEIKERYIQETKRDNPIDPKYHKSLLNQLSGLSDWVSKYESDESLVGLTYLDVYEPRVLLMDRYITVNYDDSSKYVTNRKNSSSDIWLELWKNPQFRKDYQMPATFSLFNKDGLEFILPTYENLHKSRDSVLDYSLPSPRAQSFYISEADTLKNLNKIKVRVGGAIDPYVILPVLLGLLGIVVFWVGVIITSTGSDVLTFIMGTSPLGALIRVIVGSVIGWFSGFCMAFYLINGYLHAFIF